jgi:hypothetical protein
MKHDGRRHDGRRHDGHKHGRRFHGPGFAFGFAAPYYDDYAYYDTCWRARLIRGAWRRVWVCDYPRY